MTVNEISALKRSPMFHFSLGSKELFHSNFIAWISTISSVADNLNGKQLFKSILNNLGVETSGWGNDFEVLREKNNLDLTVCRHNDENGKKGYLLVVENKLKSVPSSEQVARYNKEKNGVNNADCKMMLTLMSDFPDRQQVEKEGWKIVSYTQLCEAIRSEIKSVNDSYIASILADYCNFTDAIDSLAREFMPTSETGYYISNKDKQELINLRIYDLIDKMRFAVLASEVKKLVPKGFIRTGYGHGNAMLEIWTEEPRKESDGKTYKVIQIQGDKYAHGIYPCEGAWGNYVTECPNFFKKNVREFQKAMVDGHNGLFIESNLLKVDEFGKFKAKNDGEFRYQYAIIAPDTTVGSLMDVIISDFQKIG